MSLRSGRPLALVLVLICAARADAQTASAAVSGTITSADDATPLARARVILQSAALGAPRVLITGADGRYEFDRLPPGSYGLVVTRSGYVSHQYGEPAGTPAKTVTLSAGQRLTGIGVSLARAGIIAGSVLDEDDKPFAGIGVQALVSGAEDNRSALVAVAAGATDDRGDFRLGGLPAGRYFVSANDPAFENVGDATGPLRYSPTYYSGVVLADQATPITVVGGVEPATKAVFKLHIVHPVRVSGAMRTEDRRQLLSGAMIMTPVQGDSASVWPARDVRFSPNGTFVFSNVPPGRYLIRGRAEVEAQGTSLFAGYTVSVEGQDIENIDLVLQPGTVAEGTVIAEAVKAPKPTSLVGLRVRAPFPDATTFGDALTGDVRPDGTFRIRGLMAGPHVFALEGLRPPWILKSVVYRGQDVTDLGLEALNGQRVTGIAITITDAANEVRGTVRDGTATPVANALVVIIPAAQQYWTRTSRHLAAVRTGAGGQYQVRGLPPGEYRAVASVDLDERDAYRREVLKEVAQRGSELSLGASGERSLDLALTSGALLRRAPGR